MRLRSLAFADNLPIPTRYTCNGQNVSPPFEFIDVPDGTVSFVLMGDDMSSNYMHWLVYNIPGEVTHLDEDHHPEHASGYEGPCPKHFEGVHRFRFTLFALNTFLDLPGNASAEEARNAIAGHVLETAELFGIAEGELG